MSPLRLSEASMHTVRSGTILPTYDRAATRLGIVHIGPGAFHRAHQAYYVDTLLHSDKRWAISALRRARVSSVRFANCWSGQPTPRAPSRGSLPATRASFP